MAVREVLEIGDPFLAQRAPEVDPDLIGTAEIQAAIDDIVDSMRALMVQAWPRTKLGCRFASFQSK